MIHIMTLLTMAFMSHAQAAAPAPVELGHEKAKAIAEKAAACMKEAGSKGSIAVVDKGGNLLFFSRDDGAVIGTADSAIGKAKSSNAWKRPTKAWNQRVNKESRWKLTRLSDFVAIEGGVPILMGNKEQVGAIGVSGSTTPQDDDKCASKAVAE